MRKSLHGNYNSGFNLLIFLNEFEIAYNFSSKINNKSHLKTPEGSVFLDLLLYDFFLLDVLLSFMFLSGFRCQFCDRHFQLVESTSYIVIDICLMIKIVDRVFMERNAIASYIMRAF